VLIAARADASLREGCTLTSMTRAAVVSWSDAARRELPAMARGRRLVVDYFASRCCGSNVSIGDLSVRWLPTSTPVDPEFIPVEAPGGLRVRVQHDLVPVLRATGGRVDVRGWGRFRRPVIELQDGATWLDFITGCRPRNPLRH
jgi:hypothetical protein